MNNINQQLFALIRYEMGYTTDIDANADIDIDNVTRISDRHSLTQLVCDAMLKYKAAGVRDIAAELRSKLMQTIHRMSIFEYEVTELVRVLNENEIPYILLKGAVIRKMYPEAWMRTSCDIDILVHEEDLERADGAVRSSLCYVLDTKGMHDWAYHTVSGIHIELHYKLIEEFVSDKMSIPFENIWSYAERTDGCEYRLTNEMLYCYHIAHMAKHFYHGGCGIRPFVDLSVMRQKLTKDESIITDLLEDGGIKIFADACERLTDIWFFGAEYDDLSERMEKYIISGGTYGSLENKVIMSQVKKGSKIKYAMSRIWLTYDSLVYLYPKLKGRKYLLPYYEVRRWIKLVFKGRLKSSIYELTVNSNVSAKEFSESERILRDLGL